MYKAAGCLFLHKNKILLLKRSDKPYYWNFPGGHRKSGELAIDTAKREAKEEIGHFEGYKFAESKGKNYILLFFKVSNLFKCRLNHEHIDWRWVDLGQVKYLNLLPELEKDLPKYLKIIKENKLKFKDIL